MPALRMFSAAALVSVVAACAQAPAADATSGIGVGGSIGSYSGTKVGGVEDGVKPGASLCYT